MHIAGFINTFRGAVALQGVEAYPLLYHPSKDDRNPPRLLRTPDSVLAGLTQ